ncbi:MAG: PAS domain-containing sensor histidine kinase [Methanoregula sp.]|nr:PAS domain-containing sensor histidine kinase [Methanoregula sp.]
MPEVPVLRKDGTIFYCDISSSVPLTIQDRQCLLGIFHDITDRKRAEDALRQANKQLNLLSNITRHDILNQLMALKGYLELSHDVIDKPSTLIEYIKKEEKEEKAANTIEHQITFTRDYQELGVAAPEWQSVNASIKKAAAGLPMRAVRIEVDPQNPEIFADRLFEKVFYNLIDNALRYGGDQMKTIRFASEESGTSLTIVCEDDGVGISAEDKKRLFIRGFGKNTGLGLFLSREILSITGITITENGTPGKGARFEIAVPKGMWRTA